MTRKSGAGKGDPARLGALEAQVMEQLWDGGAFSVAQLQARLAGNPAYTTIATVLTSLRRKGLVALSKDGHASLYTAILSREEHAALIMEHALDSSGDRVASMLHFVDRMDDEDLELLRDFLKDRDAEGDGR